MAGPVASILLRSLLSPTDETRIRTDLSQLATRAETNDFWIDDRPFLLHFGEEYEGQLDELVEDGLATILGWRPRGTILFAAMCNGDEDHRILADLCIRFAEQFDGIIDFNGSLRIGPDISDTSPTPPRRIDTPGGLDGVLYATSYATAAGAYATSHYGDASFLRAFLRHPSFRMVK